MVKYHIVIITSSMEGNRKMNEEKISILIGRDYGKALQLGQKLASWGAFVSYTEDSVLHILNDFMRIRPHALISCLSARTATAPAGMSMPILSLTLRTKA